MKTPELYVYELQLLLYSLQLDSSIIEQKTLKDLRRSERWALLCFWRRRSIVMAAAIRAEAAMQSLKAIAELRDKLLESTGVDEDMRPITFKQMLKFNDK
jgi:hypothetical protein